jgi:glutamyl-tRNA reductase
VNKLLHEPTVRVKDASGTARGELYTDALVELFGLEVADPDV